MLPLTLKYAYSQLKGSKFEYFVSYWTNNNNNYKDLKKKIITRT